MNKISVILIAMSTTFAIGCTNGDQLEDIENETASTQTVDPSIKLRDPRKNELKQLLAKHVGKVVVIKLWATC